MKVSVTPILLLLLCTAPLSAHHSFAADYDSTKPVNLRGKVTRIEFTNPHVWLYMDVARNGQITHYAIESSSPNSLMRNGWIKDTIPVGAQIVVQGWLAKNGSPTVKCQTIIMSDGRTLSTVPDSRSTRTPSP